MVTTRLTVEVVDQRKLLRQVQGYDADEHEEVANRNRSRDSGQLQLQTGDQQRNDKVDYEAGQVVRLPQKW